MQGAPKIAVANDLSGFGRCSLTVALPILSAMGLQGCPLPTAILSNHTGYPSCTFDDFSFRMDDYLAEWEKLHLQFDGVCTGFLANESQADGLANLMTRLCRADAVRLVDPSMADNGKPYSTCSPTLCESMKNVVAHGTVTTPNLTEACLLTGTAYANVISLTGDALRDAVFAMAEAIAALGPQQVVVTGVADGDTIANLIVDHGRRDAVVMPMIPRSFAGTGDVFAAVLFGYLCRKQGLRDAVEKAAAFVAEATARTAALGLPSTDGVEFEALLGRLVEEDA